MQKELDRLFAIVGVESLPDKFIRENPGMNAVTLAWIRGVNRVLTEDFLQQYCVFVSARRLGRRERVRRLIARRIRVLTAVDALEKPNRKLLDAQDRTYLKDYYRDSNQQLAQILQRDLSSLGYL